MTLVAYAPLFFTLAGILLYTFVSHPTIKDLGRALMWCGVLWTIYAFSGRTLRLG